MSTAAVTRYSVAEYLSREAASTVRHEYDRGEILAMAGNTLQHNEILSNLMYRLRRALEESPYCPCGADQRIGIEAVNVFTYSDVVVICGEPAFSPDDPMSVTNPPVIVEILSPSAEAYDGGGKLEYYQHLPSLEEYVLVSQDRAHIDRFAPQADGDWRLRSFAGLEDVLAIETPACRIPPSLVYENVEFAARLAVHETGPGRKDSETTH
jgi:Uma2 family endonuclease